MRTDFISDKHIDVIESFEKYVTKDLRLFFNSGYRCFIQTDTDSDANYTAVQFFNSPKGDIKGLEICILYGTPQKIIDLLNEWKNQYLKELASNHE